jgi:hypothetical protein
MNNNNILIQMNNTKYKKLAIVIDEVESITSLTSKNSIYAMLKLNDEKMLCPIFFISNNKHNKLLSDIKKTSYEIKIRQPNNFNLIKLMNKILKKENIKINNSDYVLNKILDYTQKDYRRLILILRDLKYIYNNKIINNKMIDEYYKMSQKKDEDFDLFKATNFLLQKYNCIEDCIRYYETEKVLLPLMIHQNYLECIDNKFDNDKRFHIASKVSELLSEGDIIENYIYGDQSWDINEVHSYYTCVATSYLLSNSKNEKKINLNFPTDLNKASISKINKKNILNADKCFTNKNINDYIYINLIIRNLIEENKHNECINILKKYNANLSNIESLLKVDKIKSSKTNLSTKQKKELQFYLNK